MMPPDPTNSVVSPVRALRSEGLSKRLERLQELAREFQELLADIEMMLRRGKSEEKE